MDHQPNDPRTGLEFYDLSATFGHNAPLWPYFEDVKIERMHYHAKSGVLSQKITTVMHCTTHTDAPAHVIEGAEYTDQVPLYKYFGPATSSSSTAAGTSTTATRRSTSPTRRASCRAPSSTCSRRAPRASASTSRLWTIRWPPPSACTAPAHFFPAWSRSTSSSKATPSRMTFPTGSPATA